MHRKFIDECLQTNNKTALRKYLRLLKKLGGKYQKMHDDTIKYISLVGGVKPVISIKTEEVKPELLEIFELHKKMNPDLKSLNQLVKTMRITFTKVKEKDNQYTLECFISKNLAKAFTESGDKFPNTKAEMDDHLLLDLTRTTFTEKIMSEFDYQKDEDDDEAKETFIKRVIKENKIDEFILLQDFMISVMVPLANLVLAYFCTKRLGIYHDDCIIREGGKLAHFKQGTKRQICKRVRYNLIPHKATIYSLDPFTKIIPFSVNAVFLGDKMIPCDKNYMIKVTTVYPPKNLPFVNKNSDEDYNPKDYIKLKFQFTNEKYQKNIALQVNSNSNNNNAESLPNNSFYMVSTSSST